MLMALGCAHFTLYSMSFENARLLAFSGARAIVAKHDDRKGHYAHVAFF